MNALKSPNIDNMSGLSISNEATIGSDSRVVC